MTPELAGIARDELGAAAGSVMVWRSVILPALDFLIVGFGV
ncbi:MAG TPA: hypothetical protein VNZ06_05295 [Steroidobacteraceae bacterium]|jgi:hypothetical protein|nr:hypothetical protein [Steroidobacteraceae bacterium]